MGCKGAIFSFQPYEIKPQELSRQIYTCDPTLSSEWLALCHYWLNYDKEKPFSEYPLRITNYPMVPFFRELKPDFAEADFERMISDWISRNANMDSSQTRKQHSLDRIDFATKSSTIAKPYWTPHSMATPKPELC